MMLKKTILALILAATATSLAGCVVEPIGPYRRGYYAEPAPAPYYYDRPHYYYYR